MNVILLMSGGVGSRFGANIPKQYVQLNGRPVIEYVLEASLKSKKKDKIVVVMDQQYKEVSPLLEAPSIAITNNGKDRYESLKNGLDFIKENYDCDRVIIVDAVAPFISPELIDDYFTKLEEYDMVLTGQKITGALCDFKGTKYDREDFFMAQAPEGFRFDMLYNNVDYSTSYQAISSLMPSDATRYVNFNFKNNLKLTYNFELKYAEFLLNYMQETENQEFDMITSSESFETKGLKKMLLRNKKKQTKQWLEEIFLYYKALINKYGKFSSFSLNQSSNYGLVALATTKDNYEFVLKVIPPFLNRYETEKKAYQLFSETWMCDLLEYDDYNHALFLEKLEPVSPRIFDNNIKFTDFCNRVFASSIPYDSKNHMEFEKIIDNLKYKKEHLEELPYFKNEYAVLLDKAIKYYENFDEKDLKLIHGDLRAENIMEINNKFKAIDPIGYIAPIEMEPARFIIGDIYHNSNYDCIDRLKILVNFFEKWFNYDKIIYGLYIYYVMISYNSVFEFEDTKRTEYYLDIIERMEKEILSNM